MPHFIPSYQIRDINPAILVGAKHIYLLCRTKYGYTKKRTITLQQLYHLMNTDGDYILVVE
jgi:hypothetical protein